MTSWHPTIAIAAGVMTSGQHCGLHRREWQAFCHVMGNPDWTRDEKFLDAYCRWKYQEELDRLVTEWTVNYTHYEVTEMLQKVGVLPCFFQQPGDI